MATVAEHYESLLAPVYLWMAGGIDHALALGAGDLADCLERGGMAVDLGAGFGMHAIPLARAGYRVVAIDTSSHLLGQLRMHAAGLDIRTVTGDLLDFHAHLSGQADLVVCMGDTLTHLPGEAQVRALIGRVADALAPGGRFVATFRDYSQPPAGNARFIAVRSDADRILTCFLEEQPGHVRVHDVLHERSRDGWTMKVSSYPKLRLSPATVCEMANAAGLRGAIAPGPRGMVRLLAEP